MFYVNANLQFLGNMCLKIKNNVQSVSATEMQISSEVGPSFSNYIYFDPLNVDIFNNWNIFKSLPNAILEI